MKKVLRFIADDFWRKIMALVLASVIFWRVDTALKATGQDNVKSVSPTAAGQKQYKRTVPVKILAADPAAARQAFFPPGAIPQVEVTFKCAQSSLQALDNGEIFFYVEIDGRMEAGVHELPVRCHNGRPGVEVSSFVPAKMEVSITEMSD